MTTAATYPTYFSAAVDKHDPPPTRRLPTRIGPYVLGKKIGQGAFAVVRKGRHVLTNRPVAIKIVQCASAGSSASAVDRERFALFFLNHPNIVRICDMFYDDRNRSYYIVAEQASGGELFDYIMLRGRLCESDARRLIRQIVSALEYCHAHLIVHRDLKPENVLMDERHNVKISDFGLSNLIQPGSKFRTCCGSLHYACPEILRGVVYDGRSADVWSLGIILYCMVTGLQPWSASSSEEILHKILHEGINIPAWLTPDCIDLLLRMLCVVEKDRITIDEVRCHPWVTKEYGAPPLSYLQDYRPRPSLDHRILKQLSMMGFPSEQADIQKGGQSMSITAYNLLLEGAHQKALHEMEARVIIDRPRPFYPEIFAKARRDSILQRVFARYLAVNEATATGGMGAGAPFLPGAIGHPDIFKDDEGGASGDHAGQEKPRRGLPENERPEGNPVAHAEADDPRDGRRAQSDRPRGRSVQEPAYFAAHVRSPRRSASPGSRRRRQTPPPIIERATAHHRSACPPPPPLPGFFRLKLSALLHRAKQLRNHFSTREGGSRATKSPPPPPHREQRSDACDVAAACPAVSIHAGSSGGPQQTLPPPRAPLWRHHPPTEIPTLFSDDHVALLRWREAVSRDQGPSPSHSVLEMAIAARSDGLADGIGILTSTSEIALSPSRSETAGPESCHLPRARCAIDAVAAAAAIMKAGG